ncbi:hypothetical protein V2J09_008920 [Rumex salicifolius]
MNRDSPSRPRIPRLALGNLTNQLGKRGFSLVSRAPASIPAMGTAKPVTKENNCQLTKQISLVGKKSKVEISGAKCPKIANADQSLHSLKGGKTYRLHSRGNSNSAAESNPQSCIQLSCAEKNFGVLSSGNVPIIVAERDCVYSQSVSKHDLEINGTSRDPEQEDDSEATQAEAFLETLGSQTASTDGLDSGLSTIVSTECPQFGGSRLTKPLELERRMWLKGANSDATAAVESLKSCSCSFCTKAAHIWSELHYMDAKGRISALAKSKKEASNLVRMYSLGNGIGMGRGRGRLSHRSSDLEFDLMNRSKSLFTSLEEIFGKECSQLETEFSSLNDTRESFKTNLCCCLVTSIKPSFIPQHIYKIIIA